MRTTLLDEAVKNGAFPGAVWKVYLDEKIMYQECAGKLTYESEQVVNFDTRYDLASVSKTYISAAILLLVQDGVLELDTPAAYYLDELKGWEDKQEITIRQLLTHTAGLVSNPELHKTYPDHASLYPILFSHPLVHSPGESVFYTSIGYQYLGYIIERMSGLSLPAFMKKRVFDPLHLERIEYLPQEKNNMAPTEFSVFRNRLLMGEVHDDNCYVLGGVGGHTGLFSDAEAVCGFGRALLRENQEWLQKTYRRMLFTNDTPHLNQGRTAAFVVNDPEFGDWEVPAFSHTGFTGTSLFLVPEYKLVSVLLTNRVYPTRENMKIREVRRQLHTWLRDQRFGR